MKYLKLFEEYVENVFEGVWVENKTSKNVYLVKNFNPETQNKASAEQIEKAKEASSEISPKEMKRQKEKVTELTDKLKDADEMTKQRGEHLAKLWGSYLDAKTEEEKVDALQEMSENGLIVSQAGGEKVYVTNNLPASLRKHFIPGNKGNDVTREMQKLIAKHEITVEKSGASQALADASGKHNEAGMVFHLFPSEENKKSYEANRQKYKDFGGEEDEHIDKINKAIADKIKSSLPEGAEITGAQQVGGAGEKALKELGIDPKKDPTDVLVYYKDKAGKTHAMKFSAKIYSDPSTITMKNSGMESAGADYLGETGKELDEFHQKLKKENDWKNAKTAEEAKDKKTKYKQEYTKKLQELMEDLTKTENGQKQLEKMWKEVHGCGKGVSTTVANRKTGQIEIHGPDHYCKPEGPFKVVLKGSSLKIEMQGSSDDYLELVVKTESDATSGKLLFNHKKPKPKKEKKAKK